MIKVGGLESGIMWRARKEYLPKPTPEAQWWRAVNLAGKTKERRDFTINTLGIAGESFQLPASCWIPRWG